MFKYVLLCIVMAVGLFAATAPARATDQSAAVQLCAKNPQCGLSRGAGGVNLWVDLPGGGTNEVWCPDKGECTCLTCGKPTTRRGPIGYLIRKHMIHESLVSGGGGTSTPPKPMPSSGGGGSGGPVVIN